MFTTMILAKTSPLAGEWKRMIEIKFDNFLSQGFLE